MSCKLDFDNPNRGDIINVYLDALSDKYDMEKIKRSQLGYPETGVSYSDHTEMKVYKDAGIN